MNDSKKQVIAAVQAGEASLAVVKGRVRQAAILLRLWREGRVQLFLGKEKVEEEGESLDEALYQIVAKDCGAKIVCGELSSLACKLGMCACEVGQEAYLRPDSPLAQACVAEGIDPRLLIG